MSLSHERYGVAFDYDDGHKETIEAATREAAEFAPGRHNCPRERLILAPRNAPAGIVRKLNKEIVSALHDPKMRARIADLGGTTLLGSPADLGKLIADEPKSGAR